MRYSRKIIHYFIQNEICLAFYMHEEAQVYVLILFDILLVKFSTDMANNLNNVN